MRSSSSAGRFSRGFSLEGVGLFRLVSFFSRPDVRKLGFLASQVQKSTRFRRRRGISSGKRPDREDYTTTYLRILLAKSATNSPTGDVGFPEILIPRPEADEGVRSSRTRSTSTRPNRRSSTRRRASAPSGTGSSPRSRTTSRRSEEENCRGGSHHAGRNSGKARERRCFLMAS